MDLRQLEYFVRVAELGSFSRAALALDVAQPALSRQVRLLEVELRQNLLLRNGRGAVPTEAGRRLLEHARGILHQVARAREELGRTRGALAGRVVDLEGNLLFDQTVVIRPLDVNEQTRAKYITTYAHETLNGDDVLQENFALGDLPAGRYSVAVNTSKFYQQTIVIEPGRLAWVIFTVKPPPPP